MTITLIPKIKGGINFKEFRPISLTNNYYKIITKILANILKSSSQLHRR